MDGIYLKSFNLQFAPNTLAAHDSLIIMGGLYQDKWIHLVDQKMRPKLSFVENEPASNKYQFWYCAFIDEETFYSVSPISYEIYKFNFKQGVIKTIKSNFSFVSEIIIEHGNSGRSYSINEDYGYYSSGGGIFRIGSFLITQVRNNYMRKQVPYSEIFTHIFSLTADIELEEFEDLPPIKYIDDNGMIYCVINDPEPNVAVYEPDFSKYK